LRDELRREALEKPLNGGGEDVGAGSIMELDGDGEEGSAFGGEVGGELRECFSRSAGIGGDSAIRRFAEFGFEAADDGEDAFRGAEMAEEEFAAAGLGECQEGAGVHGAEVIEILGIGGETQELAGFAGGLKAEEGVEGQGENGHARIQDLGLKT